MKITHINDYIDLVQEKFPEVPKEDIKRILTYGWKLFYLVNSYGGDFVTRDEDGFWMYVGNIYKDSVRHFKYYITKLALKLRILFRRKKLDWDGYYYFALSDSLWEDYQALIHHRGRPRKYFTFGDIMIYKLLDECKIKESSKKYIFKYPAQVDFGFKIYLRNFKSDNAELVITREPLKFKDILVNENNYEILNGTTRSN